MTQAQTKRNGSVLTQTKELGRGDAPDLEINPVLWKSRPPLLSAILIAVLDGFWLAPHRC